MARSLFHSFTILSFFLAVSARAQQKQIEFKLVEGTATTKLGKIVAIAQDNHGYMWFASQGGTYKVYRYDGNRLLGYNSASNDSNSVNESVETLYADRQGKIWIGAFGLIQLDPTTGKFKHYLHDSKDPGSLASNLVGSILVDRRGTVWVGTGGGLDRLDANSSKFIHYANIPGDPTSLSCNVIRCLYEDRQGTIWVGTGLPFVHSILDTDGGLNKFTGDGHFIRYMHDANNVHSLVNNKIRAIYEDSKGSFYVGTSGDGLHRMDRQKGSFEHLAYDPQHLDQLSRPQVKPESNWDHITFIGEDSTGKLWIGTYLNGLNRYDPVAKKITHFFNNNGFPDSTCWAGYVSREGVLWIATEMSGKLYKADLFANSIPLVDLQAQGNRFLEDSEKNLWVSTGGEGVFKFDQDGNRLAQYKQAKNSPLSIFNEVNELLPYHGDTIVIGSSRGLGMINSATGKVSGFPFDPKWKDSLQAPVIRMLRDKDGSIWITTFGSGLYHIDPVAHLWRHYTADINDTTKFCSNAATGLDMDRAGNIWAGGVDARMGVCVYNRTTGRFRSYLPSVVVVCIYSDNEGDIWVGTQQTLYRYNKKTDEFDLFLKSFPDVGNENVFGIVEDDQKNLWINRVSSILKINPGRTQIETFAGNFGIPKGSNSVQSIHKTSKGKILVGNDRGFYEFAPESLVSSPRPFNILITDLFINSHPVLPGQEGLPAKPLEEMTSFDLKNNQNSFGFNFAADNFQSSESNKFLYLLEGYDKFWREDVGVQNATYFNVSPGTYTFRVKAITGDGMRGEKSFVVRVNPPWWRTWWAISSYVLVFGGLALVLYRSQKRRIIMKERQKSQMLELQQAREIEKAYTELKATQAQLIQSEKMASLGELTAGIAHEIQNPLNFVNNFSEINTELIDELTTELQNGKTAEAIALANDIRENEQKIMFHGKRADGIVKGMLQHSRISAGQKEPTDINALADEYLRLAYHGLRAKDKMFNATMKTDFDERIGKINIIPQDMGRALLNLYNNAFYAVSEKKRLNPDNYDPVVEVTTKKTAGFVEILVRDNGNGIPAKVREKIFQPFFTTKPTGQGTGLGLSMTYDIITKLHGAELTVDTRDGEYAAFIIRLPLA